MSDEYTPTTDLLSDREQLARMVNPDAFKPALWWRNEDAARQAESNARVRADDILNSDWLAEVKREAAAEALEQAANQWHEPYEPDSYDAADWLAARAAAIREGREQ